MNFDQNKTCNFYVHLVDLRLLKKLFVYLLLLMLSPLLKGQNFHINNNVNRIDSLTLQYLKEEPKKECKNLCIEGFSPNDARFFEQQMSALGSEIDFKYNQYVHGQLSYFSYANGAFLRRAWANKSKYFPIFEEVFDKKDLPQELKYISIIESALNPTARSHAGAMGLWQFMPGTGRYLDMTINYRIDDRKSIIKSTETAADYFKTLYNMFDDWLLAIAAYNAGPGNIQKAIRRGGGVKNFWYIKKYLPRETQNYVPRFIAAVYLMNFSNNITQSYAPDNSIVCPVEIQDTLEFEELCRYTGCQKDDLERLNAQFRYSKLRADENHSFQLLLPYNAAMKFLEKKDSIYYFSTNPYPLILDSFDSLRNDSLLKDLELKKRAQPKQFYHYVRRGETLYSLSKKYRVSVTQIKTWNRRKSNHLRVGERLIIRRKS
jgi:membrane-bound lytic murein transglycosylase D